MKIILISDENDIEKLEYLSWIEDGCLYDDELEHALIKYNIHQIIGVKR